MKNNDYVKVLLYAYPRIDRLREAIECGVEIRALLSFRDRGDVFTLFEGLGGEIVTAKRLTLLEKMLKEIVDGCTQREKYLLEYKYFRRKELLRDEYTGYELECSERNYFRLQNLLLNKIAARLNEAGYDEKRFYEDFSDYAPFMRVLRAIREGKERMVVFKRIDRPIVFRQKSSCMGEGDFLPRRTNSAMANSAPAARRIIAICPPDSPVEGSSGSSDPASPSPDTGLR